MAKKSFDISSTLRKNRDTQLAPKVPLKKTEKNVEEVEKKVATIHQEQSVSAADKSKSKNAKSKKVTAKATVDKIPEEKLVRLTIDTPEAMHRKLKIRSIERGISMRDYILRLLEKELNKG